ncbi:MAG TPA: ATP-binding protein [Lachnospiraceae bacterium]|nr:ATP-binding protein [Lachnospiraceae bacterium]
MKEKGSSEPYAFDKDFIDRIPNGVGIFSYENGKYSTIYLNNGYYAMLHVRREDRGPEIRENPSLAIYEDDRVILTNEISRAILENSDLNCSIRILQGSGGYRWYNLHATIAERHGGRLIWYNSYTDIDDLVRAEHTLEGERKRYELAISSAHLAVWEYDVETKTLIVPEDINSSFARERYGITGNVLKNVPDCMLSMGLTDTDRENFLRLYNDIRSGKEHTTADVWFRRSEQDVPVCDRISYIVLKDKNGRPVRAYGSGIDITAEKHEQLSFHQSIQSILTANPKALCTFQLNLSQNKCYEGNGISQFIVNTLKAETVDGLFAQCRRLIPDTKDQDLFYAVFDRKKLIEKYSSRKKNLHVDYRRIDEAGRLFWVRTYISLLKNPESGDIEGVIYSLDISKEIRQSEIFNVITGREYDLIALISISTETVEPVLISPDLNTEYHRSFQGIGVRCDFNEMRKNGAEDWVSPEDRKKYLEGTELSRIRAELDANGVYELVFHGHSRERGSVYRKLQHYYLNEQKDSIIIIDSDVTLLYLHQQKELEEKRKMQMERKMVDTIAALPSSSALFRIRDDRTVIPESYSEEFCRMCGYSQQSNLHRSNTYGSVHPEDCMRVMLYIKEHLADSVPFHQIYRIITESGTYIWVSVTFNKFTFGENQYLYAVYTDISDIKKQEEQLKDQYDAAQSYLNSVAGTYIAVRRVNLTKNFIEYVDGRRPLIQARGITDYDRYVQSILSAIPGSRNRERCSAFYSRKAMLDAFGRGETIRTIEHPYYAADRNITWVRNTVNLTKQPGNGEIIAFSAISDISREKITAAVMDKLASTQYDYICCIDAESGKVFFYTSPDGSLGGKKLRNGCNFEQEMTEYNGRFVISSDRESCTEFMKLKNVMHMLNSGKRCSLTFSIVENGALRVKQVEFFSVDPEYHIIGLVRSDYTDIQRRQLEQEKKLREALDEAKRANAAKSDFLSRMSHDIRTPLNGIIGMTYLSKNESDTEKIKSNLDKIDTSSKFLLGLINDVLDMSKAESGKIELHPEPYTPQEFSAYMEAVVKPLVAAKDQIIDYQIDIPKDVVPLQDKLRINQIVFNILSNAVKFTPEGGRIEYKTLGEIMPDGRLQMHVSVRDNGIGMSEEFQKTLFDPFSQERRSESILHNGTGLGMAITRQLVELMGGSIRVESRVGKGSAFFIDLAFNTVPAETVDAPRPGTDDKMSPDDSLLVGKHILLCEDHPLNQEISKSLLEKKGIIVSTAENGKTGADMFLASSAGQYDAILMDIRMPVMNGYEATEKIRAAGRPDAKTIPIVAMTADAFSDDVRKCLDAGMNGHIAKPIEPETLYRILRNIMAEASKAQKTSSLQEKPFDPGHAKT